MPLDFPVPGMRHVCLTTLVLDYNGTIADRGRLIPGVAERLRRLASKLNIHVFTADTFGSVRAELGREFLCEMHSGRISVDIILPQELRPGRSEADAKLDMLAPLGPKHCCAMGNGRNDVPMLGSAGLSFCIIGREGCSPKAMNAAHIVCHDILDALDMLLEPACCTATLRT